MSFPNSGTLLNGPDRVKSSPPCSKKTRISQKRNNSKGGRTMQRGERRGVVVRPQVAVDT